MPPRRGHKERIEKMPAYVIVNVNTRDPERYEEYKKMAQDAVARFGGRYIVRGGKMEVLEGTWAPTRIVVLQFESYEKALAWWHSDEYASAKQLRQSLSTTDLVIVDALQ
jgi:uncharacterized protein (DUF1330 family)